MYVSLSAKGKKLEVGASKCQASCGKRRRVVASRSPTTHGRSRLSAS